MADPGCRAGPNGSSRVAPKLQRQLSSGHDQGIAADVPRLRSPGSGRKMDRLPPEKLLLRLVGEVNVLSSSTGGPDSPNRPRATISDVESGQHQCWTRLVDALLPVLLVRRKTTGTNPRFHVVVKHGDTTILDRPLDVPGAALEQASPCFVQWRDRKHKNAPLGLNFISEADTAKFLKACLEALKEAKAKRLKLQARAGPSQRKSVADRAPPPPPGKLQRNATAPTLSNLPPAATLRSGSLTAVVPALPPLDEADALEAIHEDGLEEADMLSPLQGLGSDGTVRLSGWLSCKHVLTRTKQHKVATAPKRSWLKFWVVLKGSLMLFYTSGNVDESVQPHHILAIDGCLAQLVVDTAKREHVLALAVSSGDLFHIQATSKDERDSWVQCVHAAAAMSETHSTTRRGCLRGLASLAKNLQRRVKVEDDLKSMAQLQLAAGLDGNTKGTLRTQLTLWERSIEELNLNIFRLDCYKAAVEEREPCNPQRVLSVVCKSTKDKLLKIGNFSPTTLFVVVSARAVQAEQDQMLVARRRKRGSSSALLTVGAAPARTIRSSSFTSPSSSPRSRDLISGPIPTLTKSISESVLPLSQLTENVVRVNLYPEGWSLLTRTGPMTAGEVLQTVCKKRRISEADHFLIARCADGVLREPDFETPEATLTSIFLMPKQTRDIVIWRKAGRGAGLDLEFGDADFELQTKPVATVCGVDPGSPADMFGLKVGDEVVAIEGLEPAEAAQLIEIQPQTRLTVRTSVPFATTKTLVELDKVIADQLCPPPLGFRPLADEGVIGELVLPPPPEMPSSVENVLGDKPLGEKCRQFLKAVTIVNRCCEVPDFGSKSAQCDPKLSKASHVAMELVETERNFVRSLRALRNNFMLPLMEEPFFTSEQCRVIFGNLEALVKFQSSMLDDFSDLVDNSDTLGEDTLVQLAETLSSRSNDLKALYGEYAANHTFANEELRHRLCPAAAEFIEALNPSCEQSRALNSLLITPIQRVLKYPLLLRELWKSTKSTAVGPRVEQAVGHLNSVASYINEMTRLSETFGPLLKASVKEFHLPSRLAELSWHGEVAWFNAMDAERGKPRKAMVKVLLFKSLVIVCEVVDTEPVPSNKRRLSRTTHQAPAFKFLVSIDEVNLGISQYVPPLMVGTCVSPLPDHCWVLQDRESAMLSKPGDSSRGFVLAEQKELLDKLQAMIPSLVIGGGSGESTT
eukprot:m.146261 g.146261  ORF g.146261 m.146261 type:complete len:1199 (+) comp17246_c0_seq3:194-3790(+)